uniref:Uncharacterized protein n=1 Tax=Vitis vinifera TaxID=29760 RepID=A5AH61_VITVI|nr:hypothetical protein VITISV_016494 [Vitis vinifera]
MTQIFRAAKAKYGNGLLDLRIARDRNDIRANFAMQWLDRCPSVVVKQGCAFIGFSMASARRRVVEPTSIMDPPIDECRPSLTIRYTLVDSIA